MKQGMVSVILAASALLAPWVALGAPSVSPAASTDGVLAIRDTSTGELRLQYRKDSGRGSTEEDVFVGIASDYHYIRAAQQSRIYDFKLRRIFSLQPGDTFINDSLYAEVW